MAEMLKTIEEIGKVNASFPFTEPARKWKEQGKKIVGWICINVPEEVIHAAGMMPFRLTGGNEEISLDLANEYLFSGGTCSFSRTILELQLRGEYGFLDCIAGATPCEGVIRLAEVGSYYHNIPTLPLLDTPRKFNDLAYKFYHGEVMEFKKNLEKFFGVTITDEAIVDSIALYNKTRTDLKKLHDLMKSNTPPLSGAEMLEVLNAAVRMPREDFNTLLEKLLEEIKTTGRSLPAAPRIMISGALLNTPSFVQSVESLGVNVVVDDFCNGSRYWWEQVEDGDPWKALAKRYLLPKCSCPRINPPQNRTDWISQIAKDFRLDGIIALTMRCCAPYILNLPMWKTRLEDEGVTVLDLDIEYGGGFSGQIRTRIEAFVEMLSLEVEI
ncbi:MAG: 2-hydroxyacyl-CoA dehydratase family protein [Proteobacteria bacterium]|nr:2-hydroxyacyl-CoA dehydratase family protein [Pseudomonadota bacterium]MBU4010039.1 2-hydroxyacyl-CoA dehydratase family protein [Pseudomonadota bacterium]